MTVRSLVFTGCGRSGTGWVAQVLAQAGFGATHEGVFQGRPGPDEQGPLLPDTVESSWFAAPFVQGVPLTEVAVVHLVRDPRDQIDSWLRAGAMSSPFVKRFLKRWCPEMMRVKDDSLRAAMTYWLRWNERVERLAGLRLRIEDLDVPGLTTALADSGRVDDTERLRQAVLGVPRNYNSKGGKPRRLEWDDLPFGLLKKGVMEYAREYGYR